MDAAQRVGLGLMPAAMLMRALSGCNHEKTSAVGCMDGGQHSTASSVRYCEHDAVPLGVQESGFFCPADW